jgi:hypothetical protein
VSADRSDLTGPGVDGATEVHIAGVLAGTGEPVDLTLPVDPDTGAFSTVLTGTSEDPWRPTDRSPWFGPSGLTLSFVDSSGNVLSTVNQEGGSIALSSV